MNGDARSRSAISHPAYEVPRSISPIATAVLCSNPSEMTFEGTNSYVLRRLGYGGGVVIDPGPEDFRHLEAIMETAGRVDLILITHRHQDHTGGIDALHRATGAPVRAHTAEHCRAGEPLRDGELIVAAEIAITVVATPGHTADSTSFAVRQDPSAALDSIVLGDTILGRDSTVLDSTDGDLGDYLSSLRRLVHMGPGVVGLTGHGPEQACTATAASALLEHRLSRLEQVRQARETLGDQADARSVTAFIYRDLSPFLLVVAEQSTLVAMRYLDNRES